MLPGVRIRLIWSQVVLAAMLCASPTAALVQLTHPVCVVLQHGCATPTIGHCCCPDVDGDTVPATPGNDVPGARVMAPASAMLFDLDGFNLAEILIVPPQAWFRDTAHRAGPPRALSVLNSSFLI